MAETEKSDSTDLPTPGISRRKFFLGALAVAGGGLALTWVTREPESLVDMPGSLEPNAFLQIRPDGQVVFQLDKVEMGQGTMTGLATLVGEELDFDPARMDVRFAPVRKIFQRPAQVTGQSRSLLDSWDVLRETGAAARAMLLNAAAAEWSVDVAELETNDGVVRHALSEREATYAEFAEAASKLSAPWRTPLKDPGEYRWIGKHVPRLDAQAKVTGQAVYGIDVQPAGVLTAVIARCPERMADMSSFDAGDVASLPGVHGLVPLQRGVAVVADDYWTASQAAKKIKLQWGPGPLAETSDETLLADCLGQFDRPEPDYANREGDTAATLRSAHKVVEADYVLPYITHATMEPMNATVHVKADSCDVWVPTQAPDMARNSVADILALPRAQVRVHTTYIGGGFGRRVLEDYVVEAALIAREFDVPVKLVWPREDDTQHGYYRQQTAHRMRGGLDKKGGIKAWEHYQVATPTAELLTPAMTNLILPEALSSETRADFGRWFGKKTADFIGAFQAREGATKLAYQVESQSFVQYSRQPGIPISIWRSVGPAYNGFVVESFVDELAAAAELDPADMRRNLLADNPRHIAVLDKVLEMSGWSERTPNSGFGLALFECFDTVVGQVAQVSLQDSTSGASGQNIRVRNVWCVVDCGTVVNPDIVKGQMESSIIFGATAALHHEINFANGRVKQSNFHDFKMMRMADSPNIEVEIIASDRTPSGVGEPGTPPIAPAIANAVYDLTGQRLRVLPLKLS